MLTKRIIPCLDVKDGLVVKGVKFKNHQVMGDILEFAKRYSAEGADELVFYDITASCEDKVVDKQWVAKVAREINIPFCVAGGIRTLKQAEAILNFGADKISINSPALEKPDFINELVAQFGQQCIVIGIDSFYDGHAYKVHQYTGNAAKATATNRFSINWVQEVQDRGAGEIVLNCMNQDGVLQGYDIEQLAAIRQCCGIPLIASGGAGKPQDFLEVFKQTNVDGALAASVFHKNLIEIAELKHTLLKNNIKVRI